jgi:serine/threonine protein kinase
MSVLENRKQRVLKTEGTPFYMSPEMIRGEEIGLDYDLYSIGVTLFYAVTGHLPYTASRMPELVRKITQGSFTFPECVKLSPVIKDLISNLIQSDVDKRMTADEFLEHRFITSSTEEYRIYLESMNTVKLTQ